MGLNGSLGLLEDSYGEVLLSLFLASVCPLVKKQLSSVREPSMEKTYGAFCGNWDKTKL